MDRSTRVLTSLLRLSGALLPDGRREWARALAAEAVQVPAGMSRVTWLCGGLWVVAREVVMGKLVQKLAFAAGAIALAWIGWPGRASNSAVPVNRVYIVGTVLMLAVLPVIVRRFFGPVRRGWAAPAARVAGYALVLALVAGKLVKDRLGSKLGAYFVVVPGIWSVEIVLLLVLGGYAAGLLILTSQNVRLTRGALPIGAGFGAVTAAVLFPLGSFGVDVDPASASLKWWGLAALVLPLSTGLLVSRLSARDGRPVRPARLSPVRQGAVAAAFAMATGTLLLATFTSVAIALFPQQVPLQHNPGPPPGGGCETCDPNNTVIPIGLRHEYLVELSVGQAGGTAYVFLLLAPFLGAGLGATAGLRRRGLPMASAVTGRGADALALAGPAWPGTGLKVSDADREQAIDLIKTAFVQGRLTKDELDTRAGRALASRTCADLAALIADIHREPRPG
ncbi:MAG: DUF1707 SHOCT-like domain-containing protein [Streptosporangiaceae bacterium]